MLFDIFKTSIGPDTKTQQEFNTLEELLKFGEENGPVVIYPPGSFLGNSERWEIEVYDEEPEE